MPTKTPVKKKTVSKPAAAKKPAAKKAVKAVPAPCACESVCAPEQSFWVNNGPVVDSLESLTAALKGMSDEQYNYHTVRDGNDFARWIRDSLGNPDLATRLGKAKSRKGATQVLASACTCR